MDDFIPSSYWGGGINNVFICIYAPLQLTKTKGKLACILHQLSPFSLSYPEGGAVITGEEDFSGFGSGAFCRKTNSKGGGRDEDFQGSFSGDVRDAVRSEFGNGSSGQRQPEVELGESVES
jgi:hypothetical protein